MGHGVTVRYKYITETQPLNYVSPIIDPLTSRLPSFTVKVNNDELILKIFQ